MRVSGRVWIVLTGLIPLWVAGGCAPQGQYRRVQNNLDRALWYYEVDRLNQAHAISGAGAMTTRTAPGQPEGPPTTIQERLCPARVPSPALVDIDSQIRVLVDPNWLGTKAGADLAEEHSRALMKRKDAIRQALAALTQTVQYRADVIRLFGKGDLDASTRAIDRFEKAEGELLTTLISLWPETTPEWAIIEGAYRKIESDPALTPLYQFLQAQIEAMEAGDRAFADRLQTKRLSLRLEAQVMTRNDNPLFLHLEGYDTLEQGRLETRDRWGLDLSPTDRRRLEEQMQATQQVAKAAEALRKKEMTLREAVASAGPFISADLTKCLLEIQPLLDKYKPQAVRAKLEEIRDLWGRLLPKVEERTASLSQELRRQLEATPGDFEKWVKSTHFDRINELFAGITSVQELRQRWLNPTFADQTALVLDSASLFRRLGALVGEAKLCAQIDTALTEYLNLQSEAFRKAVGKAVADVAQTAEFRALQESLGGIQKDFQQVISLAQAIVEKLRMFGVPAEAKEVPSANALDVPIEDIRDTFMDLRRTRLSPGDEIMLRATLKEGDKEIDSTTASFRAEHLGWYANLSPSVVLAKPTELAGGEDDFRFAPALSWLHHYVPRPEEQQWYMGPLRVLDPALGIHAIFLSFDTPADDEAIQVGLGGTLALWRERLQFGAGFNLMADSGDDGRYYFFVGTDLIGLLQTVTGQPAR